MAKQEPCCARWTVRLHTAERDLAVVARKASRAKQLGRSTANYEIQIAELKTNIALYKVGIEGHETDHAADEAGLTCTDAVCENRKHYELRA